MQSVDSVCCLIVDLFLFVTDCVMFGAGLAASTAGHVLVVTIVRHSSSQIGKDGINIS